MTTFQIVVPDVFLDGKDLALVRDRPHGILVSVWTLEKPTLKKRNICNIDKIYEGVSF
jgi:hypothetical protein